MNTGKAVLWVDNDSLNTKTYRDALEANGGICVYFFTTVDEAIEAFLLRKYALVIWDLMMPCGSLQGTSQVADPYGGRLFHEWLLIQSPETPTLLLTGFRGVSRRYSRPDKRQLVVWKADFDPDGLASLVVELINSYRSG